MIEFWEELWDFASRNALSLPTNLIKDIHGTGKKIIEKTPHCDPYVGLTWCSRDVAKKLKSKLPNSLHARMVLGIQNEYTKDYVQRFGA